MRVFFLGVDALEYNFVKDRPFPHLKQKQFFKVHIPERAMTVFENGTAMPYTPIIWRMIFTGSIGQAKPEPMRPFFQWENRTLNWLKSRESVNRFYGFMLDRGIVKPGFPERLGFKRKDRLAEEEETFIVNSRKPVVIHSPLEAGVRWAVKEFRSSEILNSAVNLFQEKRRETLLKLREDEWDLFIVYDKLLDTVGHLFWQLDRTVEKYYRMVDDFAGEIQGSLSSDDYMIVVSDHGMQPLKGTKRRGGDHSHHAYASFSHEIEVPQPLKITDLHPIVCRLLRQGKEG